jgi:superfamily II DNA/RNA helicase
LFEDKSLIGYCRSFGIVLGLLAKPRVILEDKDEGGRKLLKHVTTSLFIVPHRDLAYQLLHWIESIVRELKPKPNLESIVQVLVRGSEKSHEKLMEEMKETPPHILICTPQAFLEMHKMDNEAIQVGRLSTVVVDEVDYLVPTVVKDRKNSYWKAYEKASKKIRMHPGPTREILDMIYARRKELWENQYDPEEDDEGRYNSVEEWRNDVEAEEEIPQLVMSSATLRVHLKDYLFGESGWLNGYNLVKIKGVIPGAAQGENGEETKRIGKTEHSILVVSDTGVRNVDGAVERLSEVGREAEEEAGDEYQEIKTRQGSVRQTRRLYDNTPSPFNPVALETVAAAFALDVPAAALLVLPSSAPVRRAVYELQSLGVNAQGLDMLGHRERTADPTLLVATLATTRGLDLPELTHVFVLGIPEGPAVTGRTVDAYLHVSGRVGRFGRCGRVVSVVEGADEAKMARILGAIGEIPVQFKQLI